jgi:hypothetical protein
MSKMAGVTDDPHSSPAQDSPVKMYGEFIFAKGTAGRTLGRFIEVAVADDGEAVIATDNGRTFFYRADMHEEIEQDFALVAMACYLGDVPFTTSYEKLVEVAEDIVKSRMGDFQYFSRSVGLDEYPDLLEAVIDRLS